MSSIFQSSKCGIPPITPIADLPFIEDCGIPIAPMEIVDCPDVDLPLAQDGAAGLPGRQGDAGADGIDGMDGADGLDGCDIELTVSYEWIKVYSVYDVGVNVSIAYLGETSSSSGGRCKQNYRLDFFFFLMAYVGYYDECCQWVWCCSSSSSSSSLPSYPQVACDICAEGSCVDAWRVIIEGLGDGTWDGTYELLSCFTSSSACIWWIEVDNACTHVDGGAITLQVDYAAVEGGRATITVTTYEGNATPPANCTAIGGNTNVYSLTNAEINLGLTPPFDCSVFDGNSYVVPYASRADTNDCMDSAGDAVVTVSKIDSADCGESASSSSSSYDSSSSSDSCCVGDWVLMAGETCDAPCRDGCCHGEVIFLCPELCSSSWSSSSGTDCENCTAQAASIAVDFSNVADTVSCGCATYFNSTAFVLDRKDNGCHYDYSTEIELCNTGGGAMRFHIVFAAESINLVISTAAGIAIRFQKLIEAPYDCTAEHTLTYLSDNDARCDFTNATAVIN